MDTMQKLLLLLSGGRIDYLIKDEFTTAESAPIASPRTAEPGPGSWTVVDPDNKISISGGAIDFASSATGTTFDTYIRAVDAQTGQAGLAFCAKYAQITRFDMGLHDATVSTGKLRFEAPNRLLQNNGTLVSNAYTLEVNDDLLIVYNNTNIYFMQYDTSANDWLLVWVDQSGIPASGIKPHLARVFISSTGNIKSANLAILPSFKTDVLRLLTFTGSVADFSADIGQADFVTRYTVTTLGTSDIVYRFRIQTDNSDEYRVTITSAGSLLLQEVASGTPTNRGSTTVVAGDRVVIVTDALKIDVFVNGTRQINFTTAIYTTRTSVRLAKADGDVTNFYTWRRNPSAGHIAELNRFITGKA